MAERSGSPTAERDPSLLLLLFDIHEELWLLKKDANSFLAGACLFAKLGVEDEESYGLRTCEWLNKNLKGPLNEITGLIRRVRLPDTLQRTRLEAVYLAMLNIREVWNQCTGGVARAGPGQAGQYPAGPGD